MKKQIIYQIFPDRFCNGDKGNDPKGTYEWSSPVNKDCFMGGDLKGIIEKLDYIKGMGFTAIYLNPIFKSPSNHKYDTEDYYSIDPAFGSLDDFQLLITMAHKRDIKIILDGVFNHTSTEFFAFNDILKNQQKSKFLNWYSIISFPVTIKETPPYKACGGASCLPKLNTGNLEVQDYIIKVIKYWENMNIDGIRLDVPFEIDNSLLSKIREETSLFLIGEIWGYGGDYVPRYFDSVTNYILRDLIKKAVVDQCTTSKMFSHEWKLIENTYKDNIYNLINLAGSHDTMRISNLCGGNIDKEILFYLILFMMPGIPMIYYGDEIGLSGENDPYCRGCMDWEPDNWNSRIQNHIKHLINIRKSHPALTDGAVELFCPNDRTLVIVRYNDYEKVKCYINFGFQVDQVDEINIEAMNYKIVFRGGSDGKGYK